MFSHFKNIILKVSKEDSAQFRLERYMSFPYKFLIDG